MLRHRKLLSWITLVCLVLGYLANYDFWKDMIGRRASADIAMLGVMAIGYEPFRTIYRAAKVETWGTWQTLLLGVVVGAILLFGYVVPTWNVVH